MKQEVVCKTVPVHTCRWCRQTTKVPYEVNECADD